VSSLTVAIVSKVPAALASPRRCYPEPSKMTATFQVVLGGISVFVGGVLIGIS
jgi:hypothetical protein